MIKKSKSYIAITVLILMLVLVAITYLFAQVIYGDLAIARNNKASTVAFALAEAGVQDAIYKVKHVSYFQSRFDSNTPVVLPEYNSLADPINNGSYKVTISITGKRQANIVSKGIYKIGIKSAQRIIKTSIAQSYTPPSYDGDAGIFVGQTDSDNKAEMIKANQSTIEVFNGSIVSGGNLELKNSKKDEHVYAEKIIGYQGEVTKDNNTIYKCNCYITTVPNPQTEPPTPQCSYAPTCDLTHPVPSIGSIPSINISGSESDSYKSKSKTGGNHYFTTSQAFNTHMNTSEHNNSVSGIVYVEGDIEIIKGITITGILVSPANISVTGRDGELTVIHETGKPSGVIANNNFSVASNSNFSGDGLFYAGDTIETNHSNFTIRGAFFARNIDLKNQGVITIYFDKAIVNDALPVNPSDTQIVDTTYWEEEY